MQYTEFKVLGNVRVYYTLRDTDYSSNTTFQLRKACLPWLTMIKTLERQLFDNFIYIFSNFIFKVENSMCVKMHPYKVGESKMKELYPWLITLASTQRCSLASFSLIAFLDVAKCQIPWQTYILPAGSPSAPLNIFTPNLYKKLCFQRELPTTEILKS